MSSKKSQLAPSLLPRCDEFRKWHAEVNFIYKNPQRVPGQPCLLLTLDEKIGMLGQVQPAIPRLGIKAFTNWTEGLHGLGWVRGGSVTATTFPQSVGLGETWDPEILRQTGAVEGYEARVYFKKYNGARVGLVIRAPNVDLARDPDGAARKNRSERTLTSSGKCPSVISRGCRATTRSICSRRRP
jgi:beta-glucosidase